MLKKVIDISTNKNFKVNNYTTWFYIRRGFRLVDRNYVTNQYFPCLLSMSQPDVSDDSTSYKKCRYHYDIKRNPSSLNLSYNLFILKKNILVFDQLYSVFVVFISCIGNTTSFLVD